MIFNFNFCINAYLSFSRHTIWLGNFARTQNGAGCPVTSGRPKNDSMQSNAVEPQRACAGTPKNQNATTSYAIPAIKMSEETSLSATAHAPTGTTYDATTQQNHLYDKPRPNTKIGALSYDVKPRTAQLGNMALLTPPTPAKKGFIQNLASIFPGASRIFV